MEVDEDVLFADLSKQIALLIMDDDEFTSQQSCYPTTVSPVRSQAFPRGYQGVGAPPSQLNYGQSLYTRESKGTGVFIPRSPAPRRKYNRSAKFGALNSSSDKQMDKLGGDFSDMKDTAKGNSKDLQALVDQVETD